MSKYGQGMIVYEQVPNIRIEIADGCNRSCEFCGHRYLKTEKKNMSTELFESIISKCHSSLKSLHFTVNGEPTLNPSIEYFTECARGNLPHTNIQIITNGDAYIRTPQKIVSLFNRGANLIIMDLYSVQQRELWFKTFREWSETETFDIVNGYGRQLTDYYNSKPNTKKVLAYYDETDKFGKGVDPQHKRVLHTWCGSIPHERWGSIGAKPLEYFPHNVPCTEPLKFLNIGVDGSIKSCCRDMSNSFSLGDVKDYDSMQDIWDSPPMDKMRQILKAGRRDLLPVCFFCNERSSRFGLYPYVGPAYTADELLEFLKEHSRPHPNLQTNLENYRSTVSEDFTIFKRGIIR